MQDLVSQLFLAYLRQRQLKSQLLPSVLLFHFPNA